MQASNPITDHAYCLRGVKGGKRVHGSILLRVELLLRSAAKNVGIALVQAEADLAVNLENLSEIISLPGWR